MIFDLFLEHLTKTDWMDLEHLINLSEAMFSLDQNRWDEYIGLCRSLDDPRFLSFVITELITNYQRTKKQNYLKLTKDLLELLLEQIDLHKSKPASLDISKLLFLLIKEDVFEEILNILLSNQNFIDIIIKAGNDIIERIIDLEFTDSQSFKKILSIVVIACAESIERNNSLNYQAMYQNILRLFMKLTRAPFHLDVVRQLISIKQFQINGLHDLTHVRVTVLSELIFDLEYGYSTHRLYAELLLVRAKNLRSLKGVELPKFTWKQSNAVIPNHPDIEVFLKSDEMTFVYRGFNEANTARRWIRDFAVVKKNSCFTAVVRTLDGVVEVILQKERTLYERLIESNLTTLSQLAK